MPAKVFKKYAKDNEDKQKAVELINAGRYGTTFEYSKDMIIRRWLLIKWMNHNYVKTFNRYFKENKG